MSHPISARSAVEEWLKPRIQTFTEGLGLGEIPPLALEKPARPEHGDFATSLAMQLARPLRRNPREIAADLAAAIGSGGPVESVEVAGAGFINLRLSPSWLTGRLPGVVAAGPDWGRSSAEEPRRLQVEFVSTNPTGPLLFSHGRGAVVGDCIARLLEATGHQVDREFYINDAGRQVQLFGLSLLAARQGLPAPEGGYSGGYISELASLIPTDLLQGSPEKVAAAVTEWGIQHYLAEFREVLGSISLEFDEWFSERLIHGEWSAQVISGLEARGAVSRHDGATWIRLHPDDEKEEVLYKTGGDATYFLGDLVYHADKFNRRGYDGVIDIWGADHQNQVRRLKAAMALIGVEPSRLEVVLIQMVRMKNEDGFVKISKRAGNVVLLSDLVAEVGPDAVRYHYLLRSTDSMMDFDVRLAREQSNENPVFYAQYAHARLCTALEVARTERGWGPGAAALDRLVHPLELALAETLMELPDVVAMAARERAPHHLPHYGQRLAERVHALYQGGKRDGDLRFIVASDEELSRARLFLCEAARVTMSNLLRLMGVAAPDRM